MHHKSDWQVLRPWLSGLWSVRWRLLAGTLLLLLTVIAGVSLLGVSGWFITATAVIVVAFDIYTPGGAIRFFALLRTVSRYFERVQNHEAILRLQTSWRLQIFDRLTKLPVLETTRFKMAQVLQRLTQDLDALDNLYLRILAPFVIACLSTLLLIGFIAIWLPFTATVLALVLFASIAFCAFYVATRLRHVGAAELQHSEQLRMLALNYIEAQPELLAWQQQQPFEAGLRQCSRSLLHTQHHIQRAQQRVEVLLEAVLHISVVGVLASALVAVQTAGLSAPVAILIAFALLAMADTLGALPLAAVLWGRVIRAAQRLNTQSESQTRQSPACSSSLSNDTQETGLHQVTCAVEGTALVRDVSFTLPTASVTLLTGPSGSGKTTIAHLLAGLRQADKGAVTSPQTFTYLTQDNALLSATIAENLLLGNPRADDDALWHVLEAVELADDVAVMAEQLDTWVGDGASRLSGGQARRLVLARALLRPASLLILDEPFTGVDEARALRIIARLSPWLEGKTVLWISHNKKLVPPVQQHLDSEAWLAAGSEFAT